ncbi:MAG: GRRM system radical SAM/SPASM domain protein [Planctomycetes bacterium]|nr:GRRM system radical SAM/SPASM domain protein [Planctomycetota bacterium]
MTHDFAGRLQLLVLQGSPFCNLDCRYCYLPDRGNRARMTDDTLRAVLTRVLQSRIVGRELTIVWHAGEPLALPIAFYERAFAVVGGVVRATGSPVRITHSVQTNATTLTPAWCEFLKQHDVRVGVSIDGPRELHDQNRVDRKGHGSFDRAMAGVALLRRHDVPFHVISVITRAAMDKPDELFAFYREQGLLRVGFNIEEQEGAHAHDHIGGDAVAAAWQRFLDRMWTLNAQAGGPLVIREFNSMLAALRFGDDSMRAQDNQAFAMLNVDWQGNAATWSPELLGLRHPVAGDLTLGNLVQQSLDELAEGPAFGPLHAAIEQGISACRQQCEYFRLCGGGCPSNKLAERGTFAATATAHCRLTRQVLADVVLARVESALAAARA